MFTDPVVRPTCEPAAVHPNCGPNFDAIEPPPDGLVYAGVLDGRGGIQSISWSQMRTWRPEAGPLWVHLDREGAAAQAWLQRESGLDATVRQALLARESRPRVLRIGDGLLITLRGVNLNPGAEPEDMVAVRVWAERDRIITVRHRRLMVIQDIRDALQSALGPKTTGELLVLLCDGLIDRMGPVITDLDDRVDSLETSVVAAESANLRVRLSEVRQTTIALRRYLAPQRDVMARLYMENVAWLTDFDKSRLRETADRTMRYVEDLDAARERAAVTQDELMTRLSEQMNRTMYLLTIVAAVMLPPSLITGLLGVNVGGIPGVGNDQGFAVLILFIAALAVIEVWALRKLKWI